MPLPALPDSNTSRGYIDYTSAGHLHTLQFRLGLGALNADFVAVFNRLKGPMAALLPTSDQVAGLRVSQPGTNLAFPVAVVAQNGTNVGTLDADRLPMFLSAVGRDQTGRRVRVTFFTPMINLDGGYRLSVTTAGTIKNLYDAIVATGPDLVTINVNKPVWNPYMNAGANAYFQRKARRTVS